MSTALRVIPVDPFDLGWPAYSLPASQFSDNFHLTPAQERARHDLALASFAPWAPPSTRFVPGEALYFSVLLVNEGSSWRELTLSVEAEGAAATVWYQHPWYTHGRALLPEPRRYLVPELLLKHDRIRTPADLFEPVAGHPDHADADAPIQVRIPPGGFKKILIKARTPQEAPGPVRGALIADGERLSEFAAQPVPAPTLRSQAAWFGLYYGLIPGSASSRYRIDQALFLKDLAYLQELGVNTLVLSVESVSPEQGALLARHGIRRVVLRTDRPDRVRQALAMAEGVGLEVLFYTQDEPHSSGTALDEHFRRALSIKEGGGRTFAAISAALDRRPSVARTLDVPNTALWSLPASQAEARQALRGVYYWQCAFERPVVNRYLAGLFCHLLDARGFVPFVFRDGFPQHDWASVFEDDASPLYGGQMRQHMMTYPSRSGPLRTIQAEALHQGLGDWRVLEAVRQALPQGFAILRRQLAPVLSRTLSSDMLMSMYSGRRHPTLTAGPVDMPWLARAREKALDLLAHAHARETRFESAPQDIARVSVRYDPASARLELSPPGMAVTDFPLCLIEGFPADATPDEVSRTLFGLPPDALSQWTLRSERMGARIFG